MKVRVSGFTAKMPGCTALAQFKQGTVVTCQAVHRARCWRQKVIVAIIDLDVDRLGHECTDVFALAMLRILCCVCFMVLIIGFESHDNALDILDSKRLLQLLRRLPTRPK